MALHVPNDFRFSLDGYEELYLHRDVAGCATHLSAYNPKNNIEIALLDLGDDDGFNFAVELIAGYVNKTDPCGRRWTVGFRAETFQTFDPLAIKCIAMEWAKEFEDTHGGNND